MALPWQDHGDALTVMCPWGNRYHIFSAEEPSPSLPAEQLKALPRMTQKHLGIDDSMAVRGKPGIRFIEFRARAGSVDAVGAF